jgi:hypothetical protein
VHPRLLIPLAGCSAVVWRISWPLPVQRNLGAGSVLFTSERWLIQGTNEYDLCRRKQENTHEVRRRKEIQMKKWMLALVATAILGTSAAFAQVVVRVAPPPPVVEARPIAPSPRHVWIEGYHRWDGHRYVWVGGRWVIPPRRGVVWVPGHWDRRPGGYIWIEGHWR